MSHVSWSIEEKKSKAELFLRIRPDSRFRFRLIENPVKVIKIFNRQRQCAILESEQVGKQLKDEYPTELSDVSVRYACWCIDRTDNTMKVLDMPASVAKAIGNRQILLGKPVAGIQEGCDWQIMTNNKQGKDVRYDVVYIDESPLTEAEKEMVEEQKEGKDGYYDLRLIFNGLSFSDAKAKLVG